MNRPRKKLHSKRLERRFILHFSAVDPKINNTSHRIFGFMISLIASIPLNLTKRILQIQICLLFTLTDITKLTVSGDTREYFHFPIVNFPFICSNIPAVRVYAVAGCITVCLHESDKRNALLGSLLISTELCLISTQYRAIEG